MTKYEEYCKCLNEILIDMHRKKKNYLTKTELEQFYDYYLEKYDKELIKNGR